MGPPVAQRLALLALAALVLVVLAVWLHDVRLIERGEAALRADPQPRDVERIADMFRRAERLNPDTLPLLDRGGLLRQVGRRGEARRVFEEVVRREPDNILAWAEIERLTRGRDPARAAEARARVLMLNPLTPSSP